MAGIGFALRELLRKDSFLGLVQAYGYAGIINSGPWVLSILGVVSIGILSIGLNSDVDSVTAFLISVTYLIACSIIFGAWLQLMFTRYISDRLYDKEWHVVLPNLIGALLVTTLTSLVIAALLWPLFSDTSLAYRLIMLSNLIVLSNIWILVVMLSGLRSYNLILITFVMGYGLSVVMALWLRSYGEEGLLAGFGIGQAVMMYIMLALLVHEYPSHSLMSFDFLDTKKASYSLVAASVCYNLGVWGDKILFWIYPMTSQQVIGPVRSSPVYDPPIFIAYLAIIPGMAVFLLRMEADFVDKYDAFFNAVREGGTLSGIRKLKKQMTATIKMSITEIVKVQFVTSVTLIYMADNIVAYFGMEPDTWRLFAIDVVAVGIHVVLLAIFNVLYYLDKRRAAWYLVLLFALSNFIMSYCSQILGPDFYGFGYAGATTLTSVVGFFVLYRKIDRLEYETFMLQR